MSDTRSALSFLMMRVAASALATLGADAARGSISTERCALDGIERFAMRRAVPPPKAQRSVVLLRGAPADRRPNVLWGVHAGLRARRRRTRSTVAGWFARASMSPRPCSPPASPRLMSPSRSRIRPPGTRFVTLAHRRVCRYREAMVTVGARLDIVE